MIDLDFVELFASLPDAFAYHQVVVDANGRPIDSILLYVNRAFETMTNLRKEHLVGHRASVALPGLEKASYDWIGSFGRVAITGETLRVEQYFDPFNSWCEATAFSHKKGFFAVVFRNLAADTKSPEILQKRIESTLSLVDNAPDMIVRFDRHLRHVYCNQAVESLSGYPADAFLGKTLVDLDPSSAQLQTMQRLLETALTTGQEQHTTQRVHVASDNVKWFHTRIIPERDASGSIGSLLAVSRDVTEQQRLARMSERVISEQQLLLENIDVQIWYLKDAEHYGAVNDAHASFLGVSKQNLENKSVYAILTRDEADICVAGNQEIIKSKQRMETVEWVSNARGERRLLSITKTPKLADDGHVEFVVCSAVDVTEEKQLRDKLHTEQEKLGVVFRAVQNVAFVITDTQPDSPHILEFSPGAEFIFGYSCDEVIGAPVALLHRPQDVMELPRIVEQTVHRGQPHSAQTTLVRKGGDQFPALFAVYPLLDVQGTVWATLGVTIDVTEQKLAEERLRHQEQLLRGILESQQDLIVRVNMSNAFVYVNDAYCRTFGKERSQLIGRTFTPLVHEEDLPATLEAMKRLHDPPYRVYVEQRAMTVAGWRWLAWEDSAIRDEQGHIVEIQAVGRDITEYKQALANLKTSEERYRGIVEDQTELICRFCPSGVLTYVNQAYCHYFQKEPEELIGQEFLSIIPAESRQHTSQQHALLTPDHPVVSYEHRMVFPDGTVRWQQWYARALFDEHDRVIEYQAVGRDMTAQKLAEEKLRTAGLELENRVQERTQELKIANDMLQLEVSRHRETAKALAEEKQLLAITLSSIGDGVIATDIDGTVSFINKRAEEILGCSQDAAQDQPLACVLPIPSDQMETTAQDFLCKILSADPKHTARQDTLLTQDNQRKTIEHRATPIKDEQDTIVGNVIIFRDITRQQKIERQLALTQKLDSIGSMTAGIAHEISSPMQYIADNAEFLRSSFLDVSNQLANKDSENRETKHLLAEIPLAISDLLDGVESVTNLLRAIKVFSHPGNDQKQPADLNEAVRSTLALSRNEWKYCAQVHIELDDQLPLVHCRVNEISQVILNMLVNASHTIVEAIDRGIIKHGEIHISTKQVTDQVQITIKDNGMGIPPQNLQRVFDPFFTTKDVGKGTGQGLAIAYDIITGKHQGHIDLESTCGEGAAFTISLPIFPKPSGE